MDHIVAIVAQKNVKCLVIAVQYVTLPQARRILSTQTHCAAHNAKLQFNLFEATSKSTSTAGIQQIIVLEHLLQIDVEPAPDDRQVETTPVERADDLDPVERAMKVKIVDTTAYQLDSPEVGPIDADDAYRAVKGCFNIQVGPHVQHCSIERVGIATGDRSVTGDNVMLRSYSLQRSRR